MGNCKGTPEVQAALAGDGITTKPHERDVSTVNIIRTQLGSGRDVYVVSATED